MIHQLHFNADSTSHINFTGATILNISHGVLIPGTAADYEGTVGTSKKYNGMSNNCKSYRR